MYQRFVIGWPALISNTKNERNAQTQQLIGDKKEDRRQRRHDEDHDGRHHGLAARRPGHLGGLRTHLLYELEWIRLRHLLQSIRFRPLVAGPLAASPGLRPAEVAGVEGLEPPTPGFGDRCSTS